MYTSSATEAAAGSAARRQDAMRLCVYCVCVFACVYEARQDAMRACMRRSCSAYIVYVYRMCMHLCVYVDIYSHTHMLFVYSRSLLRI